MIEEKSALIVVDMQNGFLEEGAPIFVPNGKTIINNIVDCIKFFRIKNCQIIWTRVDIDTHRNTQYQHLFPNHFSDTANVLSRNSHAHMIVPELNYHVNMENDIIIDKHRYSAFVDTTLERDLLGLDIKNLYFCGVTTNVCVESSLRDAFQRNFNCYLLSDCTKTFSDELQNFSEEVINFVFGKVISLSEAIT